MYINAVGVSIEDFDRDPKRGFMTLVRWVNIDSPSMYTNGKSIYATPTPFDKGVFELPGLEVPGWLNGAPKEAWELYLDAYATCVWERIGEKIIDWVKSNKD
ncbi:MAG: hypothetical protein KatS3mg031_2786 [Chitinophagales bacterium]|nr:MAG: hypothetical protein KatS3mg031_2786 [Chitinophagales bacterium]